MIKRIVLKCLMSCFFYLNLYNLFRSINRKIENNWILDINKFKILKFIILFLKNYLTYFRREREREG